MNGDMFGGNLDGYAVFQPAEQVILVFRAHIQGEDKVHVAFVAGIHAALAQDGLPDLLRGQLEGTGAGPAQAFLRQGLHLVKAQFDLVDP